jgi:hypothetical protein
MLEAILRAEKREELLFLAVFADTHCVSFAGRAYLWVVDAATAHATCVLVVIVLFLHRNVSQLKTVEMG